MQTAAFLGSEAYSATDGFVSVTEGQAFANEVVCKVRGSRIAEHDSFTHTGFVDLDADEELIEWAHLDAVELLRYACNLDSVATRPLREAVAMRYRHIFKEVSGG